MAFRIRLCARASCNPFYQRVLHARLQIFRSTAVQVVTYAKDIELSKKLIGFLTSPAGQKIYADNGWLQKPV
ncbi:hypothetical protein A3K78_04680 [Candidatus Bathyarchaeota archaeon RBG_13_52_12]|nr:MAG: hypothetical protein A3K78_04680 [Candidatus Bathyarchaeota archaeon RBG_13_52_12]